MTISEIINLIVSSIIILILFYQNSIIKKMKDFIQLIDITKLKESTNWILEGERVKQEIEKKEIKDSLETKIQEQGKNISQLEDLIKNESKQSNKIIYIRKLVNLFNSTLFMNNSILASNMGLNNSYKSFIKLIPDIHDDKKILDGLEYQFPEYNQGLLQIHNKIMKIEKTIENEPLEAEKKLIPIKEEIEQIGNNIDALTSTLKNFQKENKLIEKVKIIREIAKR